ncbi:hypothetical protein [Fluviispira multicolorata]|uniref:Uncharacterized protein n=1 Tax=Fluviispira multicolorata TaxID=2654512 RepID=A0A833JGR3_9BACT|nr:hypothetical protein [Fluviispira multicolorata]KAB8033133.1 hypothetical protein GCL57_00115 [Fluviispira multicolorata]
MTNFNGTGNEYKKIKETYISYLKAYKKLNHGSAEGATPFSNFYIYTTYTSKYSDPRKFLMHEHR